MSKVTLCVAVVMLLCMQAMASLAARGGDGALHKLNDPEAVCLDGSPASFYYYPAPQGTVNSNKWMIYKQGGGLCTDGPSCFARSKTDLGSSNKLPLAQGAGSLSGILSRNCNINPELCEFNLVFLNYCDGFIFSGSRSDPFVYSGTNLYFRGRQIVYATLQQLKKETSFSNASAVLLSGGSAGGYATFMHTDAMASWITTNIPSVKKVRSTPVSGYFLSRANYAFEEFLWGVLRYMGPITNVSASFDPVCLSQALPGTEELCGTAPTLFGYTKTPTFVLNSKMDAWQIACSTLGGPKSSNTREIECFQAPGYAASGCAMGGSLSYCNATQMRPLLSFQHAFTDRLAQMHTFRKPGNGAFIDSCYTHVAARENDAWTQTKINGVSMGQAWLSWWQDENPWTPASVHTHIDCDRVGSANCNPTCKLAGVTEFFV